MARPWPQIFLQLPRHLYSQKMVNHDKVGYDRDSPVPVLLVIFLRDNDFVNHVDFGARCFTLPRLPKSRLYCLMMSAHRHSLKHRRRTTLVNPVIFRYLNGNRCHYHCIVVTGLTQDGYAVARSSTARDATAISPPSRGLVIM